MARPAHVELQVVFFADVELIWTAYDRGYFEERKKTFFKFGSYVVHAYLDSVVGTTDLVFHSLFDDTLMVGTIIFSSF